MSVYILVLQWIKTKDIMNKDKKCTQFLGVWSTKSIKECSSTSDNGKPDNSNHNLNFWAVEICINIGKVCSRIIFKVVNVISECQCECA